MTLPLLHGEGILLHALQLLLLLRPAVLPASYSLHLTHCPQYLTRLTFANCGRTPSWPREIIQAAIPDGAYLPY